MSVDPKHVGRGYGPFTYELGLEKMREFAYAIAGGTPNLGLPNVPPGLHPLLYDERAGKDGPYGSVIAFPTFAVTFAMAPFGAALSDPELGVDLLHLVHAEQDFEFFEVMRPGDVMHTTGKVTQIQEKKGLEFITVVSESKNQHDKLVVRGTWMAIIRH